MSESRDPEILNIEEAAALLGVSVKTFNKVLHSECLPARKIGREWKFSRTALIAWVGAGRSVDYYHQKDPSAAHGRRGSDTLQPTRPQHREQEAVETGRRTSGWSLEHD